MRPIFLVPLALIALAGCVREVQRTPTSTTIVTPPPPDLTMVPPGTIVQPAQPTTVMVR